MGKWHVENPGLCLKVQTHASTTNSHLIESAQPFKPEAFSGDAVLDASLHASRTDVKN